VANAGPDQELDFSFQTKLNAVSDSDISGEWSVLSGTGFFEDHTNKGTMVSSLSEGENILLWTVTNGVCPPSYDTVNIYVNEFIVPSLITPNMDGINDYLIIKTGVLSGHIHLVVFDRRGLEVFEDHNYKNTWNGVDNNGKALPSDTYYYSLRTDNGKHLQGFVVVRR